MRCRLRVSPLLRRAGLAGSLAAFCLIASVAQAADLRALAVSQDRSRDEYDRLVQEISLSTERSASLAAEIATVKKDQASLSIALIDSAAKEKELGAAIEDSLARLEPLKVAEERIHASLRERRGVLAEVLGALERMGLNPPPAVLVTPDDALASVRSAILLGAVVPNLRAQTERLVADLDAARKISGAIEAERDRLKQAVEGQATERRRLALLIEQKQRLSAKTETDLAAERWRAQELSVKATSLKGLIAELERQAAEADKVRLAEQEKRENDIKLANLPVPEANRLGAQGTFGSLLGRLSLPASGRITQRFNEADSNGVVKPGNTLATQSGSIVSAPADATVLYAGPFRSYKQLLILNAGDGYLVVLTGMAHIDVAQNQQVLAGEPVGTMGETRVASAASDTEQEAGPELYVEFRRNGQPVDPAPWWASGNSGRKRNGA